MVLGTDKMVNVQVFFIIIIILFTVISLYIVCTFEKINKNNLLDIQWGTTNNKKINL